MSTNWKNKEERKQKIANTLRKKAALGILPWQIAAKEKREREKNEYESIQKTCKYCGSTYYKAWTKSGKTDFCSPKCARTFSTSVRREEINKKVSEKLKGISTHKGNTNVYDAYHKNPKKCPICGNDIPYEMRKRKTCSHECSLKLAAKTNREIGTYANAGGYREGSGRSKSGYYKGFFCGSTYELVYYIYCKDHNINIERNEETFSYQWKGKTHTYLPDFITDEGLIEVKGYHTEQVDAKTAAVNKPIKVLYLEDLEPMMRYIDETYNVYHRGKTNNYHTLYDDYKPQHEYVCSHCGKTFMSDRKLKTKEVFCSRVCAGKFGRKKNIELFSVEWIKNNTLPFEDFDKVRIDKDRNLYSNKRNFKDNQYEKLNYKEKKGQKLFFLYDENGKRVRRYL